MSRRDFIAASFAAALALLPAAASATLITYTETVDASGTLNGTAFTDNVLTLTLTGDTSSITGTGPDFRLTNPLHFTLSGGGSGVFSDDGTQVVVQQADDLAGFFDFSSFTTIMNTVSSNSSFASYDLRLRLGL
jgi:hypothetical protein